MINQQFTHLQAHFFAATPPLPVYVCDIALLPDIKQSNIHVITYLLTLGAR